MAPIELLCTADIHIGRRPSRLPDSQDPVDFSPRSVWTALAETAVERNVDGVVVAGDLVDRENRYAEAFGAVEAVATTLSEAEIPLLCVAGNHDYGALPDLADSIEPLQLLGRDGAWERVTLSGADDDPGLHVDRWSFPSRYHHESPLATYDLADDGIPRLGVVHADLSESAQCAPVTTDALATSGHVAWVLGHLPGHGLRHQNPPVCYPGSLQPLDPSETDPHGARLLTIDEDAMVETEPLWAATLQYETVTVEATPEQGLHDLIDETYNELDETLGQCPPSTELLATEVVVKGRTNADTDLRSSRNQFQQIERTHGGTTARVTDVTIETRPAIDLADRAGDDDPVGYLAGLLRALDGAESLEPYQDLIEAAHRATRETHDSNAYQELRRQEEYERPTEAETKAVLRQQARQLVDAFVDQQEGDRV